MRGRTLTADRIAEIKARAIDFSDIRELTEADFSRGRFRNKVEANTKKPLSAEETAEIRNFKNMDFEDCPKQSKEDLAQFRPWYEMHQGSGWTISGGKDRMTKDYI